MLRIVFVLSLCAIVSFARPRAACVAPRAFEANINSWDHATGFFARARMAYDAEGQQIRQLEEIEENSTETRYDSLYLFKKHTHYRVDQKTRKCEKLELNETFVPIEVLADSTFLGEVIIGSLNGPGTGVIVQNWSHKTTNGGLAYQLFTSIGCNPVSFSYYGKSSTGKDIHLHSEYFDIKIGMPSAPMFDVPKECV